MQFENSLAFARKMDQQDPLRSFRSKFLIPRVNGKASIYFTGNSLGLQPTSAKKFIDEELDDWAKLGVEGHFHAKRPWLYYHKFSKKALSKLVGAKPSEVVAMNQLTVTLHLMMVSFYRPTKTRFKILIEAGAFGSDQYAFESQVKFHGFNPDEAIIELMPREGEFTLRTEDILKSIEKIKMKPLSSSLEPCSITLVNSLTSKKLQRLAMRQVQQLDLILRTRSAMYLSNFTNTTLTLRCGVVINI